MTRLARPRPPAGYRPPWALTRAELAAWSPPTARGDRSRDAATLTPEARARGEWSALADYARSDGALREYLGPALAPALAPAVRAGAPLAMYRSTDAEDVIWPGAYVALDRAYAERHGRQELRQAPWWVLRGEAGPDELCPVGAGEFWFAPRDLGAWHRAQVEAALAAGLPVPPAVLAEHPGLRFTREAPLDLARDPRWRHLFYAEPTADGVAALGRWLRALPRETPVRLYHGTGASVPVAARGLLPTSAGRRRSLQSAAGYVALSAYPGMARTFGAMGWPGDPLAVYAATLPLGRLLPDHDQLRNVRQWSGGDAARAGAGATLADSLAWGHGARVRGSVGPDDLGRVRVDPALDAGAWAVEPPGSLGPSPLGRFLRGRG